MSHSEPKTQKINSLVPICNLVKIGIKRIILLLVPSLSMEGLDPLTRETGAVRLIPGSHRPDHFVRQEEIDVNNPLELFGVPPTEFPGSIAVETNPGDIVIFNHDLYHASFGGGTRRRMFTMNCTRRAKTSEDLELAHRYLSSHSAGGYNVKTGAGIFYPTMIDTANEDRMIHLSQPTGNP